MRILGRSPSLEPPELSLRGVLWPPCRSSAARSLLVLPMAGRGGGYRGPRKPGRASLRGKHRGLLGSGSHKDPKERVGAPGTAPLGLEFLAGIRFEPDQQHWRVFTLALLPAPVPAARTLRAPRQPHGLPNSSPRLLAISASGTSARRRGPPGTARGGAGEAHEANSSLLPLPVRIGAVAGAQRRPPWASERAVAVGRSGRPRTRLLKAGRGRTSSPTAWAALPAQG